MRILDALLTKLEDRREEYAHKAATTPGQEQHLILIGRYRELQSIIDVLEKMRQRRDDAEDDSVEEAERTEEDAALEGAKPRRITRRPRTWSPSS